MQCMCLLCVFIHKKLKMSILVCDEWYINSIEAYSLFENTFLLLFNKVLLGMYCNLHNIHTHFSFAQFIINFNIIILWMVVAENVTSVLVILDLVKFILPLNYGAQRNIVFILYKHYSAYTVYSIRLNCLVIHYQWICMNIFVGQLAGISIWNLPMMLFPTFRNLSETCCNIWYL